jgi:hypothetical protein
MVESKNDVSRLRSEVESVQGKLKGLNERLEEHITVTKPPEPPPPEHVTEPEAPPSPAPPKEAPTQTAPDKQGSAPAPPEESAIPVETSKPPAPTPPPASPAERLVPIDDKPPKYGVVRIEEKPPPKPEEGEIRFEKEGNCISIYRGNEAAQITTVCIEKTARGPVYSCGTCDWEAMQKGRERSGDCEHVQMVKKFLASLG